MDVFSNILQEILKPYAVLDEEKAILPISHLLIIIFFSLLILIFNCQHPL